MTNWGELVFLAEEMARNMKKQDVATPASQAGLLPALEPVQLLRTPDIPKNPQTRLVWLNEGPDDTDAFEETVGTQELGRDYSPMLLWGGSIFNDNSSGGASLMLRFTDSPGRVKQYPVTAGAAFNLFEMRGALGSKFRYVSDGTGTVDVRAFVTLKKPYSDSR